MEREKTFSEKTEELIEMCELQIDYLNKLIVIQNNDLQSFIKNYIEENSDNKDQHTNDSSINKI